MFNRVNVYTVPALTVLLQNWLHFTGTETWITCSWDLWLNILLAGQYFLMIQLRSSKCLTGGEVFRNLTYTLYQPNSNLVKFSPNFVGNTEKSDPAHLHDKWEHKLLHYALHHAHLSTVGHFKTLIYTSRGHLMACSQIPVLDLTGTLPLWPSGNAWFSRDLAGKILEWSIFHV